MINSIWTDATSLEVPTSLIFERLFRQYAEKLALVVSLALIIALAIIH